MSVASVTSVASSYEDPDIIPGDIVAVQHGTKGRVEGLVLGSYYDAYGHQVVAVRLDNVEVYHAVYPSITRVKRTYYGLSRPTLDRRRTIERRVYW